MHENDVLLKIVAENQALFDALKTKFKAKFSLRSISHKDKDDLQLGQFTRARLEGSELVESVFLDIARLKAGNSQPRVNQAR